MRQGRKNTNFTPIGYTVVIKSVIAGQLTKIISGEVEMHIFLDRKILIIIFNNTLLSNLLKLQDTAVAESKGKKKVA